jgi:hypothetical protein
MAGEGVTIGQKTVPEPSVSFQPLFEIGRVPGKWYLAHGATIVHGETIGSIVGHVTDMMAVLQSRIVMSELVAARRKGDGEGETPGAQSRGVLAALEDVASDTQEETPEPAARLDYFLDHVAGKQILRMLRAQFGDSDPTLGTENTFEGGQSTAFYRGMLTAFLAVLAAKMALAKELRGKADVRALDLFQALVGRLAAGEAVSPKRGDDGRGGSV